MEVCNAQDIEKLCTRIYSECNSLVTWNWDERFQAVLSEFSADSEDEVIAVLEKHFDSCWDEETIHYAPGKVRSAAKGLGEVREGQRLYCSDPARDALLLGAYWPWQNGQKVSLRMLVDVPAIELGDGHESVEGAQTPVQA